MARPTKFTEAVAKRILKAIRDGCTYRDASVANRISEDTLLNWRKRNSVFSAQMDEAEAGAITDALATIRLAAKGTAKRPSDWRAAAWLVERRRSKEYGNASIGVNIGANTSPTTSEGSSDTSVSLNVTVTQRKAYNNDVLERYVLEKEAELAQQSDEEAVIVDADSPA
jgi:hypothetical protein